MPLDGISLLNAPTSASWTGGTAITFQSNGTPVATGIHVSDTTETDMRLQKHITFKNRNGKLQADGSFSKIRKDIVLTIPFELDDGSISYQVGRLSLEIHPEFAATAGNTTNLRHYIAQVALDTDTDNFYNFGSVK